MEKALRAQGAQRERVGAMSSLAEQLAKRQESFEQGVHQRNSQSVQQQRASMLSVRQNAWAQSADSQLASGQLTMPSQLTQDRALVSGGAQAYVPVAPLLLNDDRLARNVKGRDIQEEPWYTGKIKVYFPEKGHGFIESSEANALCGGDILLLKSNLSGVTPEKGDTLRFRLGINKHRNEKNLAIDVQFMNSQAALQRDMKIQAGVGKVFPGILKKYEHLEGFGYVDSEEFNQSLRFSKSDCRDQLATYMLGATMYFTLAIDEKGPKAIDVHLSKGSGALPPQAAAPPGLSQGSQSLPPQENKDSSGDAAGASAGPVRRKRSGWDQRDSPY